MVFVCAFVRPPIQPTSMCSGLVDMLVYPWRACARVTLSCVSVCVCVCVSVTALAASASAFTDTHGFS